MPSKKPTMAPVVSDAVATSNPVEPYRTCDPGVAQAYPTISVRPPMSTVAASAVMYHVSECLRCEAAPPVWASRSPTSVIPQRYESRPLNG